MNTGRRGGGCSCGIAGVWSMDRRPLAPPLVDTLQQTMQRRCGDAVEIKRSVHCAMAGSSIESHTVQQNDDAAIVVSYAGTIHGDSLGLATGCSHAPWTRQFRIVTSERVAKSYLQDGVRSLGRLVGDFALSLWDSREKSLILLRDSIGSRTLYYTKVENTLFWASHLEDLLTVGNLSPDVNDDYVIKFIQRQPSIGLSPFNNVSVVRPGEALCLSETRTRTHRVWSIDALRTIEHSANESYEAEFEERFRHSVRRRLMSAQCVAAELSGGFDSSSIVGVADALCREEGLDTKLNTVSMIYEGPASDESAYIESVERLVRRPSVRIGIPSVTAETNGPRLRSSVLPSPKDMLGVSSVEVYQKLQEIGCDLILSGVGGDHLMWSAILYPPHLSDHLSRVRVLSLHRELMAWGRTLRRSYFDLLLNGAVRPVLPTWMRWRLTTDAPSSLLRRERVTDEGDIGGDIADNYKHASPGQRSRIRMAAHAIASVEAGIGQAWPIGSTYPFLDRDFIEFCLAVPSRQMIKPDTMRSLQKRALARYLPADVAKRTDKATFDHFIAGAVLAERQRMLSLLRDAPLEVVRREYVCAEALKRAVDRCSVASATEVTDLWLVWGIEMWLRGLSGYHTVRTPN